MESINILVFTYHSDIIPLELVKNREEFDKNILWTEKDKIINDKNTKSIDKMILSMGKNKSDFPVELYYKNFEKEYQRYHLGPLSYYHDAYINDYSIIIAPWIIWDIILDQVSEIIKINSDLFRDIFTISDKKITIIQYEKFDISDFSRQIRENMPNPEILNIFFPSFENLPENYKTSSESKISYMFQDYYSCMVLGCLLPEAIVHGSQNDWNKLHTAVCSIINLIQSRVSHKHNLYLTRLQIYVDEIKNSWNISNTWRNFYSIERCGSGSQETISGDIRKLLMNNIDSPLLIDKIPNMVSRFPFLFVDEKGVRLELFFRAGLVGSKVSENGKILEPCYDNCITGFL